MEDKKREQFVDDLLDASLARHRSAEPRAALEQRVLARLRAEQETGPWFGWSWRLAAGVAAFAIVVATAHWARRTVLAPGTPTRSAGGLSTETNKASAPVSPLRPEVKRAVASHTARTTATRTMKQAAFRQATAEPRKDIFPSPAPLSAQERLLLAYIKLDPSAALRTLHADHQEIEEIQIKPLEIAPLEALSAQSENVTN